MPTILPAKWPWFRWPILTEWPPCRPPPVSAARTARLVGALGAGRPAYRALADALRLAVADGRIAAGTRLPSERELTAALDVSRTTVTRAYAVLRDSGYLTSRRGSGSVATPARRAAGSAAPGSLFPADVGEGRHRPDLRRDPRARGGRRGLRAGRRRSCPRYLAGAGYLTLGVPELREVIAERYTARGLPTEPRRGARHLRRGRRHRHRAARPRSATATGSSSRPRRYPNTVDAAPARRRPARAARHGPRRLGRRRVRPHGALGRRPPAALLIPDFHNPTGRAHGRRRPGRARPRPAARRAPCRSSTRRSPRSTSTGGPMPLPFAAHDPRTISVGSSSKSHWGGLRTGWVRAPRTALAPLVEARVTTDLGAPVLEQLVLLELMRIAPGLTEAAARRPARVARRPGHRAGDAPAGAALPGAPWRAVPVVRAARRRRRHRRSPWPPRTRGCSSRPGPRFAVVGGLERWVRLPYVLAPEVMTEAVERLARAVERRACRGAPRRRRGRRVTPDSPAAARSWPDPAGAPRVDLRPAEASPASARSRWLSLRR